MVYIWKGNPIRFSEGINKISNYEKTFNVSLETNEKYYLRLVS